MVGSSGGIYLYLNLQSDLRTLATLWNLGTLGLWIFGTFALLWAFLDTQVPPFFGYHFWAPFFAVFYAFWGVMFAAFSVFFPLLSTISWKLHF